MKYAFIGHLSEIIGEQAQKLTRYGQVVELDQAYAETLIAEQNLPIVPADQLQPVPKDAKALADHSLAARVMLHEYRTKLRAARAAKLVAEEEVRAEHHPEVKSEEETA